MNHLACASLAIVVWCVVGRWRVYRYLRSQGTLINGNHTSIGCHLASLQTAYLGRVPTPRLEELTRSPDKSMFRDRSRSNRILDRIGLGKVGLPPCSAPLTAPCPRVGQTPAASPRHGLSRPSSPAPDFIASPEVGPLSIFAIHELFTCPTSYCSGNPTFPY